MAVKVILDFTFQDGKADEALAILKESLKDTRAFEGNLRTDVWQDSNKPEHVILYEEWESMENDTAYRQWRQTDEGAVPGMADLVAGAPAITWVTERDDI